MENKKQQIKAKLNQVECAIRKHKYLAAWGNVESREHLRDLRQRKKVLQIQLNKLEC